MVNMISYHYELQVNFHIQHQIVIDIRITV